MQVDRFEWLRLRRRISELEHENKALGHFLVSSGLLQEETLFHTMFVNVNVKELQEDFDRLLEHLGFEIIDIPEKRELRVKG